MTWIRLSKVVFMNSESEVQGPRLEVNSDGRAGDVRFRSIQIPTPTGRSYVGGMVAQGVSKDCIFNEDFGHLFKSAVSSVVFELHQQTWPCQRNHFWQSWSRIHHYSLCHCHTNTTYQYNCALFSKSVQTFYVNVPLAGSRFPRDGSLWEICRPQRSSSPSLATWVVTGGVCSIICPRSPQLHTRVCHISLVITFWENSLNIPAEWIVCVFLQNPLSEALIWFYKVSKSYCRNMYYFCVPNLPTHNHDYCHPWWSVKVDCVVCAEPAVRPELPVMHHKIGQFIANHWGPPGGSLLQIYQLDADCLPKIALCYAACSL